MHDLKLAGVHEDGEHLLLTGPDGEQYLLGVDEPLRAAVRRDRARLGQLQIEMSGQLRPRDVQVQIRAGASAEEVATRSGWPLERVRRYEGAVLAERAHIAALGQAVTLRRRGADPTAPTLSSRVHQRLAGRGGDPSAIEWDSWRAEDGPWMLTLRFVANGREREARWLFDLAGRSVTAQDDEARWLSEDEQATAGPLSAPHLSAVPTAIPGGMDRGGLERVYDVDAEGGLVDTEASGAPAMVDLDAAESHSDVVGAMRSRRHGRRRQPPPMELPHSLARHRGRGRPGDPPGDAGLGRSEDMEPLPLEPLTFDPALLGDPPAAHPFPGRLRARDSDSDSDSDEPAPPSDPAPARSKDAPDPTDRAETRQPPRAATRAPLPVRRPGRTHGPDLPPAPAEMPVARRARRASVPSWDEIMFGGKRD